MAHPMKESASEGHNAKLRRMTTHYGSANPSMTKLAPVDADKEEGEEDVPSFGADSSAAKPRGDRPARRTTAANPLSTYKKGGRVKAKKRADGGDVDTIEEANRDQAMSNPQARARGGRTKGKGAGHTHVSVIVAPQGAGAGPAGAAMPPPVIPVGGPPGMPPGAGAAPPPMPPRPPMGAGMPPGGPMAMPPGMPPPGMMPPRAKGGRVHADKAQDVDLIKKTLKNEGLIRSDKAEKMPLEGRARGGKINVPSHMTAGAVTGLGRLEKIEMHKKHEGKMKKQAV